MYTTTLFEYISGITFMILVLKCPYLPRTSTSHYPPGRRVMRQITRSYSTIQWAISGTFTFRISRVVAVFQLCTLSLGVTQNISRECGSTAEFCEI